MTLQCLNFDSRTYILQTDFTYSNDKSVNCSMAEWRIEIAFFWHGWLRKMADVWSNGKRKIGKEIAFRGSRMLLVIQPRSITLYNKNADISRSFFIDETVNYTEFGTESRKKVHNFMQLFWKKRKGPNTSVHSSSFSLFEPVLCFVLLHTLIFLEFSGSAGSSG